MPANPNILNGDQDATSNSNKLTKDGLVIEGYEAGGITEIVVKDRVQMLRDTYQFFMPVLFIVAAHLTYYFTGNWMIFLFLGHLKIITQNYLYGEETKDTRNISKKSEKVFYKDVRFKIPLYACHLAETLTWVWALCLMSDQVKWESYYLTAVRPKTWLQYHCFAAVIGFITSINITCGHELVHNRDMFHKVLGMTVFTKFFYSHFMDEHVQGHHKLMCTPMDGASARKNESIYQFLPREWYMGRISTWRREVKRIKKHYGEDVSTLQIILYNKMTWLQVMHLSICLVIYQLLGWSSLKYQLMYTCWGTFWLIGGNYIEHYGLERLKDKNGIYESITKLHSWNHADSGLFFKINRHSDHHVASFKPYQILRRFDDVPWMPFSFVPSFWVGIIPPFWYYCLNPRVEAVRDIQLGKTDNKTCYTNAMAMTEHDKWIKRLAWGYISCITFIMGYLAFFTPYFKVL